MSESLTELHISFQICIHEVDYENETLKEIAHKKYIKIAIYVFAVVVLVVCCWSCCCEIFSTHLILGHHPSHIEYRVEQVIDFRAEIK